MEVRFKSYNMVVAMFVAACAPASAPAPPTETEPNLNRRLKKNRQRASRYAGTRRRCVAEWDLAKSESML